MAETLDLPDLQGLIARGYGALAGACYILLTIDERAAACRWLQGLAERITPGDARPQELALNVAFTSSAVAQGEMSVGLVARF